MLSLLIGDETETKAYVILQFVKHKVISMRKTFHTFRINFWVTIILVKNRQQGQNREIICNLCPLGMKLFGQTIFIRRSRIQDGIGFHIDTKGSVKVDRDGTGLLQVWRQQITQFHNVTGQVADAIIREYPSPALLYQVPQKACEGVVFP